jgi:hypothetical protein
MQIVRFIGVVLVLCVGLAGQGDAQMRATEESADILARTAILNGLIDTFTKCLDQPPKGAGPQCDVYYAQVHQTSLDVFLSPVLASSLKAKLTATDIEDLKSTISINIVNVYYYGKGK